MRITTATKRATKATRTTKLTTSGKAKSIITKRTVLLTRKT